MERLPTEMIIQVLSYMSMEDLKVIGFISSEYRSLVLPFLFHRIRLWSWAQGLGSLITCLQNNVKLASAVRVLNLQVIWSTHDPSEDLRRIIEITTQWEEFVLPTGDNLPLVVFDDNTRLQLRRLRCTGRGGVKFRQLLVDILPTCTNLVGLDIPDLEDDWFMTSDPTGSATATWVNRLRKYRGPSSPLGYPRGGAPLYQLTSTTAISPRKLQRLGRLVGQQLVALYVDIHWTGDLSLSVANYLPPSTIPSLFPNLQYVGWFPVMSQRESVPHDPVRNILAPTSLLITHIHGIAQPKSSGDEGILDANEVLSAIKQLHHLRQVWLISHQCSLSLPEPVSIFIQDVQKMSLPYLHAICLWTPNSEPPSYAFRKERVESANDGFHTKWTCETGVWIAPVFD